MEKWEVIANNIWDAILKECVRLHESGLTLQEIADKVGVGNRVVIGEWIRGNRKATNTSFSNLMNYLENLGFSYQDFFPKLNNSHPQYCINCSQTDKILRLQDENATLKMELNAEKRLCERLEKIIQNLASGASCQQHTTIFDEHEEKKAS